MDAPGRCKVVSVWINAISRSERTLRTDRSGIRRGRKAFYGRMLRQLRRSRKVVQSNRRTSRNSSVSLSHSQIDGSGTPLNVVVLTIE